MTFDYFAGRSTVGRICTIDDITAATLLLAGDTAGSIKRHRAVVDGGAGCL